MIGNSFIDYLKIHICIGALRLIPAISVAYLACCAIFPEYFIGPIALYAAAETAFFLFVYLPRRSRLQAVSPASFFSFLLLHANFKMSSHQFTCLLALLENNVGGYSKDHLQQVCKIPQSIRHIQLAGFYPRIPSQNEMTSWTGYYGPFSRHQENRRRMYMSTRKN